MAVTSGGQAGQVMLPDTKLAARNGSSSAAACAALSRQKTYASLSNISHAPGALTTSWKHCVLQNRAEHAMDMQTENEMDIQTENEMDQLLGNACNPSVLSLTITLFRNYKHSLLFLCYLNSLELWRSDG